MRFKRLSTRASDSVTRLRELAHGSLHVHQRRSTARPLMGKHHFLPPGREIEIPTGIDHESCEIKLCEGDRFRTMEYQRAGGVLRMKAIRLQEGWVRVDFLPEIHHGEKLMRPTPTEEGQWSYRGGQNIDARHAQRFSLTMNVGELALITSASDLDGTLGDRFFCYEDRGTRKQRVLIVRIVDSGQASKISLP